MFKNTLQVVHKHQNETDNSQKLKEVLEDAELLQNLRKYFLLLTHYSDLTLKDYSINEECNQYASNHFVQQRKNEAESNQELKTD